MLKRLAALFESVVGSSRVYSIEHRLFSTVCLVNGAANVLGSFNLFSVMSVATFALTLFTGIVFLFFYYLSRFRSIYRNLYWPNILLIVVYLFFNALTNAGTLGGTHYYLIPAVLVAAILARRQAELLGGFLLPVLATGLLLWVEANHPDWIQAYATPSERLPDVAGQLIFLQFFTGALVIILKFNLNAEREKSDRLLLNVLPEKIAEELRQNQSVEPLHYERAAVLFTDFVGFTKSARSMPPAELVSELDRCFSQFDSIATQYGLEKIKTIGDAYMAVAGLPVPSPTFAVDAVLAALELRERMAALAAGRAAEGRPVWEIRIGLHSGPLVAGVIGRRKFAYDVWGDTVNVASRMESFGEPGAVNISRALYDEVQAFFECNSRGKLPIKNAGEVEMLFVIGLHPHLRDSDGFPNEAFDRLYRELQQTRP